MAVFMSRMFGQEAKEYDENTRLLLHGEKIEDSSMYGMPLTNVGTVISSDQSKFGGKSLYFNGSSRIMLPHIPFGSGDFTIDWWEYVTSSNSKVRFSNNYTSASDHYGGLLLGYNGTLVYSSDHLGGGVWDLISGVTMFSNSVNQWVHWAVVRSGNTFTTYRNGSKFAATGINGTIYSGDEFSMCIGDYRGYEPCPFIGYIDEFRISDVARWTSNFTPPTEPYTPYKDGAASGGGNSGGTALIAVTITGSGLAAGIGNAVQAYAQVNNVTYTSAATLAVEVGTEILLYVSPNHLDYDSTITVDGRKVVSVNANTQSGNNMMYVYTVTAPATINLACPSPHWLGTITVVTQKG